MICIRVGITQDNLKAVYSDDYIKRAVTHDGRAHEPVKHHLATYISCFINDVFVGAFLAIRQTIYEFEIHSLLMRKAHKRAGNLFAMLIEWCFEHDSVMRITAKILEPLHNVVKFAMRFGFEKEGFIRHATKIDGTPVGVHIMGLIK